mmetsp:Transcript_39882/g.55427  ORF Transcript_39882/g.55427 Transcript_39882/m.55427 type:complete len:375 (+) Transcript_39882:342-1466(+)|eukprot:CAMPEP_0196579120 /NCGR_PEP_ID=MMETSP1081-20130531/17659_1 /TAXON_ID=36882 /ORGANISM="Pyramimonas amylifera, Strain CCMP720" /LENGTH=374 /DNA_ID=CAMNT_0041898589 /DNA_START=339 /DNA_END=1463 /DNA_ORIENTATION=-
MPSSGEGSSGKLPPVASAVKGKLSSAAGIFSRLSLKSTGRDQTPSVPARQVEDLNVEYPSLADFEILDTLGTGTFGRVRLVQHKTTGQFLALKILKKHEVIRLKQVDHILSEKSILAQLNHPFIIGLYSTYQDVRNLYMLLEYSPGGEIFSHLRKSGRFPGETARYFVGSIILALEYMHSKDIVYRDLKPENLLLDRNGKLKIADFGFAKKVPDRTWTLCGTPEYLAPEIIQSKGHGKGADWWAVGVLIFEFVAGYPPFYDENPFGIYQKILSGKVDFPRHFDQYAKDLVKKLLVADLTQRYGNLKDGSEDIKRHRFFHGFDFHDLMNGRAQPPIVPVIANEGDTKNFDKYPESADRGGQVVDDATSKRLFNGF